MNDNFVSTPAKGAIVRDLTGATITVDLVNSLGEKFHFEVKPNEIDKLPARASSDPHSKSNSAVVVNASLDFVGLMRAK